MLLQLADLQALSQHLAHLLSGLLHIQTHLLEKY
jgi:hypothetical protein